MHSALDEVVPLTRVGGQVGFVHVIAKRAMTCYPPSFPPIARQFGGKLAKLTNALKSPLMRETRSDDVGRISASSVLPDQYAAFSFQDEEAAFWSGCRFVSLFASFHSSS
jgi:hypothetical protein